MAFQALLYCEQQQQEQQQHQQQQQDQDQQQEHLCWVVTLLKLILFVQKSLKESLTLFCCEEHNWLESGTEGIGFYSFPGRCGDTKKRGYF